MTDAPAPSDLLLLRAAIDASARARDRGDHPFGAVLADADGRILLTAGNTVNTDRDVTGHAETNLVRLAWARLSPEALADATLATSCEPCPMCSGAIHWAGVGRVVYALAESTLAGLVGDDPANPVMSLGCRAVLAAGSRTVEVVGPAVEDEARVPHLGFWRP